MRYSGWMCPVSTLSRRKIILLEELNLTRDEKRKTDEELKKTEEKLRLAHETIRKMELAMKTINEKMQRVVAEKGEIELALADIIDGHNINKQEARKTTRLKMNKIKKCSLEGNVSTIRLQCHCYPSRGYNCYVRIF